MKTYALTHTHSDTDTVHTDKQTPKARDAHTNIDSHSNKDKHNQNNQNRVTEKGKMEGCKINRFVINKYFYFLQGENSTLQYLLSGTDGKFDIRSSGHIVVKANIDREEKSQYKFTVNKIITLIVPFHHVFPLRTSFLGTPLCSFYISFKNSENLILIYDLGMF